MTRAAKPPPCAACRPVPRHRGMHCACASGWIVGAAALRDAAAVRGVPGGVADLVPGARRAAPRGGCRRDPPGVLIRRGRWLVGGAAAGCACGGPFRRPSCGAAPAGRVAVVGGCPAKRGISLRRASPGVVCHHFCHQTGRCRRMQTNADDTWGCRRGLGGVGKVLRRKGCSGSLRKLIIPRSGFDSQRAPQSEANSHKEYRGRRWDRIPAAPSFATMFAIILLGSGGRPPGPLARRRLAALPPGSLRGAGRRRSHRTW